jgi:hypothetical protein
MNFKKKYTDAVYKLKTIWLLLKSKKYIVATDNSLLYHSNMYHAQSVCIALNSSVENDIIELEIKQQVDELLKPSK